MSSRSANDRYRPDSEVSWIDGMPPRSRNERTPTGPDTLHAIAASSLESPSAIFIQNPRSTSRRTGGRPGDRIAGRPVSVTIHPRGRPIQHLHLEMLRRPVEFTIRNMVRVVRPGGYIILRHRRNEGMAEAYRGLHQWDFDVVKRRLHDPSRAGRGERQPRLVP